MTDPIQTRAAEPLWAAQQRRPAASEADSEPASPSDTVTISADAAQALKPVEESQETTAAEDTTHAPSEEEAEESGELTLEDKQLVSLLRARDQEVRAHESAHISASGGLAGGASYSYETGPDGKRYAIGGEVKISSPRTTDPQQALANAERMRAAAMAPASPSSQDRAVAARATAMASRARDLLAEERDLEADETSEGDAVSAAAGDEEGEEERPAKDTKPARMGGPTAFGPAEHLHSDGCGYCSAAVARFRMRL